MVAKVRYFIRQSWLVIVASFCLGLLIAVTDAALAERILQNRTVKLERLMGGLLEGANTFKPACEVAVTSPKGKTVQTQVYEALSVEGKRLGWAFNCRGPGFADTIELVTAVDARFEKLAGFAVLASSETPGFGDRIKQSYYREQFVAAPAEALRLLKTGDPARKDTEIVAITGATVSSKAVVDILNAFILPVKKYMQKEGLLGDGK